MPEPDWLHNLFIYWTIKIELFLFVLFSKYISSLTNLSQNSVDYSNAAVQRPSNLVPQSFCIRRIAGRQQITSRRVQWQDKRA